MAQMAPMAPVAHVSRARAAGLVDQPRQAPASEGTAVRLTPARDSVALSLHTMPPVRATEEAAAVVGATIVPRQSLWEQALAEALGPKVDIPAALVRAQRSQAFRLPQLCQVR